MIQNEGNGWSHNVSTLTPGIPGDSGSGFLNDSGQAIGILSTLQLAPLPGSNGVGDLGKELAYLHANTSFPACSWCRAPSRSRPTCWKRSSAPERSAAVQLGQEVVEVERADEHLHLLARLRLRPLLPAGGPSRARARCRRGRRGRAPR